MTWGTAPWGGEEWGRAFEVGAVHLLYITRMGPNFRKIADIIDKHWGHAMGVLEQIRAVDDVNDGHGDQLDVAGAVVQLEREGLLDPAYRRAIKAQAEVLKSTAGTVPSLLAIWAAWTDTTPDEFQSTVKQVLIGGTIPTFTHEASLVKALQDAAQGGTVIKVYGRVEDGSDTLLFDCAADPVSDPGELDCAANPISGSAVASGELYP